MCVYVCVCVCVCMCVRVDCVCDEPVQLQALNKTRVQQRKRTIDEATRMGGKSFVSGHVDPKIQRTIEDMAPLLHKPRRSPNASVSRRYLTRGQR